MRPLSRQLIVSLCLLPSFAWAGTQVNLSAEAVRPAANDLVRTVVFSEASGSDPGELARRVNQDVAQALKLLRGEAGVTVKSGQQSTYPLYGRDQKIDSWRMRSELIIESRDVGRVSTVLGQLQQMRLAVGSVTQMPSPEIRRQVEDAAAREAIEAFKARAAVIADALGKKWTIRELTVQQGGGMPMPVFRGMARAMAADAAPAPIEAGESQVTATVSGQIELSD